jgi:carboxypeptidase Taq
MTAFESLFARMQELKDLSGVLGLLMWDQETYLPRKSEPARASQNGTMQALYHEKLTDPRVGEWLAKAEAEPLSDDQRAMIRVFRHERDRAVKVPAGLVKAIAEAQSHALGAWREAREQRTFKPFQPALAEILKLRRQQADAIGHDGERYDALLDGYEPGMRVTRLTPVLQSLREKLVPLVATLSEAAAKKPDAIAGRTFPKDAQWKFTIKLLEAMGFDLDAGRQDLSIHPFTQSTHALDVRLTTRIDEQNPYPALFGTIHEGGHGLYEQGFAETDWRTPLAAAPSMGLHESQSRLWENIIGRSRAFWEHFYPSLKQHFPAALDAVSLEDWLRSVNRVARTLVRTESDEVTYNLHIVLRYEIELLLIRDQLPLDELPGEWNRRIDALLGVRPKDDVGGVLQDIHWAWGEFGYFPTYSLGNLYSAALWKAMRRDRPELDDRLRRGDLLVAREWLREKVHRPGFRTSAEERVRAATGEGLTDAPFLEYLKQKYGALYGVAV